MSNWSPITPPDELFNQWFDNWRKSIDLQTTSFDFYVAIQAARWGADQELEACVEWLQDPDLNVDTYKLCAARRPKPPRLKEQALSLVPESGGIAMKRTFSPDELLIIRRALEALDD